MSVELVKGSEECLSYRDLFSPLLDGEISPHEKDLLAGHLLLCEECRLEFDLWKRVSEALKTETVNEQPPEGFTCAVMSRINQAQKVRTLPGRGVLRTWRAPAAAAAAAVLLFAGSWGVNVAFRDYGTKPGMLAQQTLPAGPVVTGDQTAPEKTVQPGNEAKSNTPDTPSGGSQNNGGTISTPKTATASVSSPGNQAGSTVLLTDTKRDKQSTILKIATANTAGSRELALQMASASGGGGQLLNSQKQGNGELDIILITVPRNKGAGLLTQLSGLGSILDRSDDKKDLTLEYTAAVNRLNQIQAAIKAGPADGDRNRLEAEASGLQTNIANWDTESKTYTIILWLQQK